MPKDEFTFFDELTDFTEEDWNKLKEIRASKINFKSLFYSPINFSITFDPNPWSPYFLCVECGSYATARYVYRNGSSVLVCEAHRVDSNME